MKLKSRVEPYRWRKAGPNVGRNPTEVAAVWITYFYQESFVHLCLHHLIWWTGRHSEFLSQNLQPEIITRFPMSKIFCFCKNILFYWEHQTTLKGCAFSQTNAKQEIIGFYSHQMRHYAITRLQRFSSYSLRLTALLSPPRKIQGSRHSTPDLAAGPVVSSGINGVKETNKTWTPAIPDNI